MKGLCLQELSVSYGPSSVISHLNLTVAPGQIVAVLGENGSGKTTLLRAISGTARRVQGHLRIGESELSTLSIRRRALLCATMPQDLVVEPGLCGLDRIEMSFYPQKGPFGRLNADELARIHTLAAEFGISHLLARDLTQMSVGERQMVFLLGAAVQSTPVLLLDEPTSALDFNRTEAFFDLLHRLAGEGRAILCVLHDPTQALRHADGLLILSGGEGHYTDLHTATDAAVEEALHSLYPHLKIHRDPLFCYAER